MKATEIIEKLEEKFKGNEDYFAYDIDEDETNEFGECPIVDECGDREGGGDYSMVVRHFKDYGVYIRQTGFYSSYNGTDWNNDFTEVKPTEKTITVYE
jgi:hypothetical protein